MATLARYFGPLILILACAFCAQSQATPPPTLNIPPAARASANFDVKAATDA
jgi:hypothetical protein